MTNSNAMQEQGGYAAKRRAANTAIYIILSIMAVVWIFPIFWLVVQSFSADTGVSNKLFPEKGLTMNNYINLFSDESKFGKWYMNTLIVAVFSMLFSTLLVLMVSYAFSRMRFKSRKTFLNIGLILGMFPGFMSMAATYEIMKAVHLESKLPSLVIVYSAGAGLGYQIAKGFFDTISRSLDEAAMIDGATRFQIFYKIILPLSKPIIVYTALTSFIGPWTDYVFASYFMMDATDNYTVAAGLYTWTKPQQLDAHFLQFCAGAVMVAVPITILFTIMQRFYVAGVTGGAVKG